ncbi:hypothetical protein IKE82_00135 [Candidatus Saccharibacteria bacterium]|nr:hypothetical protein [Candidatus Saccharibacteria bacterium]
MVTAKIIKGLVNARILGGVAMMMAMGGVAVAWSRPVSAATSTLSLSIDNSTVSMNVSPTNTNGSFNKSSASTISVTTDNATGYILKIAAPSNAGSDYDKLVNSNGDTCDNIGSSDYSNSGNISSNCLNSVKVATTESVFKGATSTGYNGLWGYLPSKYNSSANSDFRPAPTTSGDIIDETAVANSVANTYSLAIGARVDSSVKTGPYTNTFVILATANAIPYTITYVDDTVSNMPIDVDTTSPTSTVTISSSTPTRNGYTFNGWCTVVPTTNADGTDTCSGTTVQAGGTITINQTDTTQNNFTLHAMWKGNYSISNLTYLQDFTYMDGDKKAKIYLSMTPETNYTLKDSRDNQDYTIAKLKDGNIWMTKNLNIAGGTTLTCDTTDCDGGYTLPSNQGWQSTAGQLPASTTEGFSTDNYAYVYNSGNPTDSVSCGASGQNTPCYSYYSWDVATLGSGRSITTQNTDAPYSICPKGWRLPTSGQHDGTTALTNWKRGDFYRLLTAYGANLESAYNQSTNTFWNNAGAGTTANFLLSGYYNGSTFNFGGSRGLYWSSTSTSSTYSRYLNFNTGFVNSANNVSRRFGFSVRCLLR